MLDAGAECAALGGCRAAVRRRTSAALGVGAALAVGQVTGTEAVVWSGRGRRWSSGGEVVCQAEWTVEAEEDMPLLREVGNPSSEKLLRPEHVCGF